MDQKYFEDWTNMAKKMQEPLHALSELNTKTFQKFQYVKPEDLTQVKSPEEFMEKQIHIAVENGHHTLNYMKESFLIMEKAMLSLVNQGKTNGTLRK